MCCMHRSPLEEVFAQKTLREEGRESPFACEFSEPLPKSTTCACCKPEAPEYALNCGRRKGESELGVSDAIILHSRREVWKDAIFLLPESEPPNKATNELREIAEKK